MKNAITWIRENARLIGVILVAVVGALLGGAVVREARRTKETVKKELDIIDAGKRAAKDAVVNGEKNAIALLEKQHKQTIESFNDAQKKKYESMRNDPRALARHLSRLSSK